MSNCRTKVVTIAYANAMDVIHQRFGPEIFDNALHELLWQVNDTVNAAMLRSARETEMEFNIVARLEKPSDMLEQDLRTILLGATMDTKFLVVHIDASDRVMFLAGTLEDINTHFQAYYHNSELASELRKRIID